MRDKDRWVVAMYVYGNYEDGDSFVQHITETLERQGLNVVIEMCSNLGRDESNEEN